MLAADPDRIAAFTGKLGESGQTLLAWYQLCDEISLRADRVAGYAFRLSDTDTADGHYQALRGKAMNLMVALRGAMSFAEPELMQISDETLDRFYAETPDLELYRRTITASRVLRDHILSPAEEKILAAASDLAACPEGFGDRFPDHDLPSR